MSESHLRELLQDPDRSAAMQAFACGIHLDFSRQRLSLDEFEALMQRVESAGVAARREAMFAGQAINTTENRAVLHVALRGQGWDNPPWGAAISRQVDNELSRMLAFADTLHRGEQRGARGELITDVVNLGIGGSDLGPRMAARALCAQTGNRVRVHYLSNPDAWAVYEVLRELNPHTTLCIMASKTFTTQETVTNANTLRAWQTDAGLSTAEQSIHWAAVTAAFDLAQQQGFLPEQMFTFWDWVGGRYSLWSALGLPLAIAIGSEHFKALLAGARAMDEHFCLAPPRQNLPMVLAALGDYNRNVLGAPTMAMACYASRLSLFVPFIQQMDMESNGKSVAADGAPLDSNLGTGPIVWGGLGIDGQHAYFQLLHQGTHLVPIDFIGVRQEDTPLAQAQTHHQVVLHNMQAQARALAHGRDAAEHGLPSWKHYRGNVPSNVLLLDALTPAILGALIALYEHKVFVQGVLWGINSYDQWGVELGKLMVKELEQH